MKQAIPVQDISIVPGITTGTASKVSVDAILRGDGPKVYPTVKHWNGGKFALVFGINHLYAAKERKDATIECEVVL